MDFNGCGLTYRKPYGAGRARRRAQGAGLTYRKPYGAGQANGIVAPLAEGDVGAAAMALGTLALGGLVQYYIIKWAVRAARKG